MALRKSMLIGAWVLVALNLVLAFGAIALLTRMTPAIATILEQNDYSLEAGETMLAVLAARHPDVRADVARAQSARRDRFLRALERAETNITEEAERPVVARIRAGAAAALAGDAQDVDREVKAILELASINRAAMLNADLAAQRLGTAGAWGVVFMAAVTFVAGLLFIRLLNVRVFVPLEEMRRVLDAAGHGDAHRRCAVAGAPADFRALFAGINAQLDRLPVPEE